MQQTQVYQQARLSRDARFDGTFFVAVKSTGIFCRPICPAPAPKEENVEYFDFAQLAVKAGYRPCLRCRPDSAPASYAWRGVDTTVERGLKLLGQYPQLSLAEIADKLGITDRYLRVLFQQKLGISPKKYQLYEQLLFAKQLLFESGYSVEQVAQASGFSSSRRLQQNLKQTFGLTPSQIRSKPGRQDNVMHLQLAFRPPYDWQQVSHFLCVRAIEGMEEVSESGYSRTISLDGVQGWFSATINVQKSLFDVALSLDDIRYTKTAIAYIRRVLDLEADPAVIGAGLASTGLPLDQLRQGIRIPGIWDTFEAGCRAVLGQQISVKAAINLVQQLVHNLGEEKEHKFFFPRPEVVADCDLAFLKIPQRRKDTLRTLAEHCRQPDQSDDPGSWLALSGIGPWTVAYAQMRGQSLPDIWLNTDLVIKKQCEKFTLDADQAAPWRSYLTFQLWSLA